PAPDTAAMRRAREDSIRAAEEARRRAEEDAARRRAEEEARAREAAMAQLRNDLAAVVLFDYDAATIRPGDEAVLDRKAAIMQANPNLTLQISGHADERGADEYNLALGNRRALAAKRYLVNKGIEAGRIETISYGEERGTCSEQTEDCFQRNRRDEFAVTAGGENLQAPSQ
ncbi:MAG: OmpA family protein, partial [Gemmatimonadota bacterium]|nr:OmpA family protein [Gemmatimonadota bacterium]